MAFIGIWIAIGACITAVYLEFSKSGREVLSTMKKEIYSRLPDRAAVFVLGLWFMVVSILWPFMIDWKYIFFGGK